MKKGRLFIVSGPSGVGKTTLLKRLINNYKDQICFSVSFTSREPRKGEINGKDYNFVSKDEFENGVKDNIYLEYALVHDNYYGTSKKHVDDILYEGKDCILDIDVQGGLNLMNKKIEATYIFIAPPSVKNLKERLLKRSTDSIDVINKRVEVAESEIKQKDKYQYIIINDDIDAAYNKLEEIYLKMKLKKA